MTTKHTKTCTKSGVENSNLQSAYWNSQLFGTRGGQSLAKSRFRLLWIGVVMMKALLISLQQPSVRYVYLTHLNDMKITAKISTAVLLSM